LWYGSDGKKSCETSVWCETNEALNQLFAELENLAYPNVFAAADQWKGDSLAAARHWGTTGQATELR
jgi:hypothetical protein